MYRRRLRARIPAAGARDVTPRPFTLGEMLRNSATENKEQDALVFPASRQTHEQLNASARRWAKAFIAMGVEPGENVGILLSTRPEFVEILFGATMAGAAAVPVNARYQAGELAYLVKDADLVALITTGKVADSLDFANAAAFGAAEPCKRDRAEQSDAARSPAPPHDRLHRRRRAPPACGQAPRPLPKAKQSTDEEIDARIDEVDPQSIALILYTSGTTANPKGCMIRHRGIVGNSRNLAERYDMVAGDRFWSPLPIFHIAGHPADGRRHRSRRSLSDHPGLRCRRWRSKCSSSERATHAYPSFVTIMQDLIEHPQLQDHRPFERAPDEQQFRGPARLDPGQDAGGDAAYDPGRHLWADRRIGHDLHQPSGRPVRAARPSPGRSARRMGSEDRRPRNRRGTARSARRAKSWRAGRTCSPAITTRRRRPRETIDRDGWLHTGDIGSFDEHGHIMFHGRTKDMLKVGGENVAAAEIEGVLQIASCGEAGAGRRHPARALRRSAGGLRRACRGFAGKRGRADRSIAKGKLARFKIPRHCPLRDGMADVDAAKFRNSGCATSLSKS